MQDFETIRRAIEQLLACHEAGDEVPDLKALADAAGQSPSHFQRRFVALAGVSPKEFVQALSLDRAKAALAASSSVQEAAWAAGLSGPSRLHDLFMRLEGLSPGRFKLAGEGLQIDWTVLDTLLGHMFMAATAQGIMRLAFVPGPQADTALTALQCELPGAQLQRADAALAPMAAEIQARLRGAGPSRPLGLAMSGSPLRLKVWQALMAVPEGQLLSYAELARRVGAPRAVRAVASCVASNEIAYLVPCHRVIRADARWGEYRWGSHTKSTLIGLELARHRSDTHMALAR